MFRILLLLLIFQRAKSNNTFLFHRCNIIVTKKNMEPTGCVNMRLTFHVGKEVEYLNGQFSVHHGSQTLEKANFKPPISQDKKITVELRLLPCKSYSNIEIRSYHNKTAASRRTPQAGQPKHIGTAVLIWHQPQHQHHRHHQQHHHQQHHHQQP